MNTEQKNPNPKSEHEKKNEGGREFGHVHDPTQAQQASKNQGQAGNQPQRQDARPQQSGTGSVQSSQQSKPPGNTGQEQKKTRQDESKSA